jgi:RimJ/RimL family protein N-acetyltransferase
MPKLQNIKKPFFTFPDINPVEKFSFEKFTSKNFRQLFLLFKNDDNVFTDERFKTYASAKAYAKEREQYGAFSSKHGGQDWLFLYEGNYAGIVHLYDLSLETFAENHKRCWIGYAIKPELRNRGLTKQVVQIFINYIFENYPLIKYMHVMTDKNNNASQALLQSLNFSRDLTKRVSQESHFYLLKR